MHPRLSSLTGADSGDTDVYIFCAPRSWRKNVRTLFYALTRGRNYSEDGNIRAAQRTGAEIAESLMICDINAIVNELRAIKNAISALDLSVTVPPARCCPPSNGEPGLPPPPPEPVPGDTPPGSDLPLAQVYCRAARALARNLRAILRDLAELALFNALTPREVARALTQLGLDQNTVAFISVTVGLVALVFSVLNELLDNIAGSLLQALHDALLEAANAIDEELFTCCFAQLSQNSVIVDCCKQKIDELDLNALLRAFIKLLVYEEKVAHFVTGKARNAAGELVDIDWAAANVSAAPCCEGLYRLKEATQLSVEAATQCTYEPLPENWYRVTPTGTWPGFRLRKRYSEQGFTVVALVIIVRNHSGGDRELREDLGPALCHTFTWIRVGEESKVLVVMAPNPPAELMDFVNTAFPGAVVGVPPACNPAAARDFVSEVRYGPGGRFDVKVLYIVRAES